MERHTQQNAPVTTTILKTLSRVRRVEGVEHRGKHREENITSTRHRKRVHPRPRLRRQENKKCTRRRR